MKADRPTATAWSAANPGKAHLNEAQKRGWDRGVRTATAVCAARDLVNEPGNMLGPIGLADRLVTMATASGIAATVRDETRLGRVP